MSVLRSTISHVLDKIVYLLQPNGAVKHLVIGPLLFFIFINDLPYAIRTTVAMLYTDDLNLSKAIN